GINKKTKIIISSDKYIKNSHTGMPKDGLFVRRYVFSDENLEELNYNIIKTCRENIDFLCQYLGFEHSYIPLGEKLNPFSLTFEHSYKPLGEKLNPLGLMLETPKLVTVFNNGPNFGVSNIR